MTSTRRSVGKTLLRNRRKAVRGVSSRRTGRVSRIRGNPKRPMKRKDLWRI
jgi:hypothetical protein